MPPKAKKSLEEEDKWIEDGEEDDLDEEEGDSDTDEEDEDEKEDEDLTGFAIEK